MSDPGAPDPSEIADRIGLSWDAPAQCPDESAVRRDVGALLNEARPEAASFDAVLTREADAFRLQLNTRWSDGSADARTFTASSCEELTDAAVLLMAISLDPVTTAGSVRDHGWDRASVRGPHPVEPAPVEPAPEFDAEPEPEATPPAPADPPARPAAAGPQPQAPPRTGALTFGIRPALTVDWGSLPRLAPGPTLNLSITWKLLRAELVGVYLPRQRATRSDVQKQGAWVSVGAAAPRVCVTPTTSSVSFPVCAGIELGAMRARGIGSVLSTPEYQFWVAATGGPTLIWAFIPRLALAIGLDVVVPITRTSVITASLDRLHEPEAVVLRPHLGLEVRL